MCCKQFCSRAPCGCQVLIGVLWVTFLITVSIFFLAFYFLEGAHVQVSLGNKDEYVVDFPKILCSHVKIKKHEEIIDGYKSTGTGCVMVAEREEYGRQQQIRQSESHSYIMYGRNWTVFTHRLKSRTQVPYYGSTHEIDDWTDYEYRLKASANGKLNVQTATYSSQSELEKHFKLNGPLCEIDDPHVDNVGQNYKLEKSDQGVETQITVFCADSDSYTPIYDSVTLNVDVDVLKFNEVLGQDDSCSDPPDDVEVYCKEEFGPKNAGKDTECEVPLKLVTKQYFDKKVYSMQTPVVIVVDEGTLNFTATCKIRLGWLYFISAAEALIMAVVMTIAVCCFKNRDKPC